MKRCMVIKGCKHGDAERAFEPLSANGRGLPTDAAPFDKWTPYWDDPVEFDTHKLKPKRN